MTSSRFAHPWMSPTAYTTVSSGTLYAAGRRSRRPERGISPIYAIAGHTTRLRIGDSICRALVVSGLPSNRQTVRRSLRLNAVVVEAQERGARVLTLAHPKSTAMRKATRLAFRAARTCLKYAAAFDDACSGGGLSPTHCDRTAHRLAGCAPSEPYPPTSGFPVVRAAAAQH